MIDSAITESGAGADTGRGLDLRALDSHGLDLRDILTSLSQEYETIIAELIERPVARASSSPAPSGAAGFAEAA